MYDDEIKRKLTGLNKLIFNYLSENEVSIEDFLAHLCTLLVDTMYEMGWSKEQVFKLCVHIVHKFIEKMNDEKNK